MPTQFRTLLKRSQSNRCRVRGKESVILPSEKILDSGPQSVRAVPRFRSFNDGAQDYRAKHKPHISDGGMNQLTAVICDSETEPPYRRELGPAMLENVIPSNRYSGITLNVPIIVVKKSQGLLFVNVIDRALCGSGDGEREGSSR